MRVDEDGAALVLFCKLLGVRNADEFVSLLNEPQVCGWWLSHGKYVASPWHTFSPLDQYPQWVGDSVAVAAHG